MGSAFWTVVAAWVVTGLFKLFALYKLDRSISKEREQMMNERSLWMQERQHLLDRIQAPSFGEMKQAEVKIIKAQQGHKEPPPLEPL